MDEQEQRKLLEKGSFETEMCSEFIIKYFEAGSERDQKLKSMEDVVKNLCILDRRIKERTSIVEVMKNEQAQKRAAQEEKETDVDEIENLDQFDEDLEGRLSAAMQKIDTRRHPFMVKYNEKVKSLLKQADKTAHGDNEDEELVFTEESDTYIDPITKIQIVDPVKSKVCKHQFSRQSIIQQINAHPQKYTKCPYVGCNKRIAEIDLETDYELAQKLDRVTLETQ